MNKILVAYATMTGNTSTVAETIQQHLITKLPEAQVKLLDMADLNPVDLLDYDLVILGSSTWDDGDVNQVAREFLERLNSGETDLAQPKFAIFGLGDSFYPEFCKAADVLKINISEHKGQVVGELLRLDGFPDDEVMKTACEWADTLL